MTKDRGINDIAGGAASLEVSLVDEGQYDALYEFAHRTVSRRDPCELDTNTLDRIGRFLALEARLLDERAHHDWLDLMTPDCIYWVPSGSDLVDPRTEVAVNFDDRRRLLDRITLLDTGFQVAQLPISRTCRSVTNIEAWAEGEEFEVRSNLVVWEHRRQQTSTYAGCQMFSLTEENGRLAIRFKIIRLIDPDEPQGNTTFII